MILVIAYKTMAQLAGVVEYIGRIPAGFCNIILRNVTNCECMLIADCFIFLTAPLQCGVT